MLKINQLFSTTRNFNTINLFISSPELVKVEKEVEVVLKFPDVDALNPPVLTMTDVAFQYNSDKVIFNCVNLNADLESRICIVSSSCHFLIKHIKHNFPFDRSVRTAPVRRQF